MTALDLESELPSDPVLRTYVLLELAWKAYAEWMTEWERRLDAAMDAHRMVDRAHRMIDACIRLHAVAMIDHTKKSIAADEVTL